MSAGFLKILGDPPFWVL